MRIDSDLLHVAAEASPAIGVAGVDRREVRAWVGKLATEEKARRAREAAIARAKYLDGLVGREARLWADVENLVATSLRKSCERAVQLLLDLRDLDARGKEGDFRRRLETLRAAQTRKRSFIERLGKAGL